MLPSSAACPPPQVLILKALPNNFLDTDFNLIVAS